MDHHEKLAWAKKHIEALDGELDAFFDKKPVAARVEIDRKGQRILIYGELKAPKPPHWPLMIGDAVHNLRSALDHVVWAFSTRNMAVKRLQELKRIQFPICTEFGDYWDAKKGQRVRRMAFVDDTARTRIDGMQPYHGGNRAGDHPLAHLNALSNEDKHHQLIITATAIELPLIECHGFGKPILQMATTTMLYGSIERNAPVASLDFFEPIPETDVSVKAYPFGDIIFDVTTPDFGGAQVIQVLERAHDFIRNSVFPPLDALLV